MVSLAHSAAGVAQLAAGDLAAARASFAAAEHGPAEDGEPPAYILTLGLAIEAALVDGDLAGARGALRAEEARPGATAIRMRQAGVRCATARVALADGDLERALASAHEGLSLRADIDDRVGTVDALELLAAIDAFCDNGERAARLLGAASASRRDIGYVPLTAFRERDEAAVADARASAGAEAFDAAFLEGESLSLADAVAYARRGRGGRRRPTAGWASLTPAEREVASLVAEGLDNPAIAARLFISPRTVNSHLGRIYRKLGVSSRVQLAGEVTRRQA
jgi:DNA-binding CsgD family transcriptional regulator